LIHPWNRAAEFSRIRASQPLVWLAGALAAGCCVAACTSGAASTAATTATSSATAADQASSPAASTADRHGSPRTVLADWLHQIVVADYKAACADMADTSEKAATGPGATAACTAKAVTTLSSLHENFTVDGLKAATPISVTSAQVTGAKATVSGTQVRAKGSTLSSLIIAHSTGVTSKSFALSFKLSKVDGGWYVTNLDMNI
jgi:hypothetical protein